MKFPALILSLLLFSSVAYSQTAVAVPNTKSISSFQVSTQECQLPKTDKKNPLTPGFPRSEFLIPNKGVLNNLFIFVDFSDYQSLNFSTLQSQQFTINVAEFFTALSYGKANFKFTTFPEVIRLDKKWQSYGIFSDGSGDSQRMIQDTIKKIDSKVDFTSIDLVTVITPKEFKDYKNKFSGAISAEFKSDEKIFKSAVFMGQNPPGESMGNDWAWRVNAHELGHIFGITHPYLYSEGAPGPIWDLMGNGGTSVKEFLGWHRFLLDWFNEDAFVCFSKQKPGNVDLTLSPLSDLQPGIKFSMIKLNSTTALGIESRRISKFDKLNKNEEGVLVYLIDVKKGDDKGIITILGKKRTYKDGQYLGALTSGDKLTYNGVNIEILKPTKSGNPIRIKF
jgi:M6 family metalloprotease-like protein